MASLSCLSSSISVTNKPNSFLQSQQKTNFNTVSFSSLQRQARNESAFVKPSVLPLLPVLSSSRASTTTKAVPSSTPLTPAKLNETVEHIVLFKMKPDFEAYEIFIDAMNSLKTLPGVLYLSSGYIHDVHSAPLEGFTVFLHSRHLTREHLDLYMGHRLKYGFTMTYTEPTYADYMIIDYVHSHDGPLDHPGKGDALRTAFFKLKDGYSASDKEKVLKVASEHLPGSVDQITFGDSFEGTTYRPAHKGYQLGALALFPNLKTMKKLHTPEEYAKHLEGKLVGTLVPEGGVFVVDYEVKEVYNGDRDTLLP
ncbi:hypothetical protein ACHQM5_007160 [Ranunculus cassubicifolius]